MHMCVYVCLTMVSPRGRNGNVCIAEEKYVKKFSNLNIFPLFFHPFPHAMTVVTFHRLLAIVGTRRLQKVREGRYNNPNDPSRA